MAASDARPEEPLHVSPALATPIPLGLFAYAIGNVVLAGLDFRWVSESQVLIAAILMVGFVAPLQFTAGVIALLGHEALAGTVLGFFGATWLGIGVPDLVAQARVESVATALFLAAFGVVAATLAALSARDRPIVAIVLALTAGRAAFAAAFEFGAQTSEVAGAFALGSAAAAWYGGTATLLLAMTGRSLPLIGAASRGTASR